jgi:hypothetical protein
MIGFPYITQASSKIAMLIFTVSSIIVLFTLHARLDCECYHSQYFQ